MHKSHKHVRYHKHPKKSNKLNAKSTILILGIIFGILLIPVIIGVPIIIISAYYLLKKDKIIKIRPEESKHIPDWNWK
jgi:hypothetical protein